MATDPLIGTTIGGCMIMEVIGQGGMGVIYKSRQKSLDRVVALKVLAPHLANDVNFVGRFQREARAIARVNHPNILAVYDVGDDQNVNYMIMELIDGQSLAELQTERRGALPWEDSSNYIKQSAQGLEAAQASGIIHRDIKPENLMVTKKGIIKVSDFGLAKDADATTTSTDAVMGTPAFMSPEQCDGKKVDGRSDIYSLGGTYYRLITGRLPFEAETAMSMMYRHKHEALIPPHEVVPSLPQTVSAIIVKMMAKKREHRYQTMTEVIEAIDQARQQPASAPPMRLPELHGQPQAHQGRANDLEQMGELPPPGVLGGGVMQDESHVSGRRAMPVGLQAPGGSRRMNAAPVPVSGRLPVTAAPPGGFGAPDSSSRMSMPSGLMGGIAPGMAVPDDAYAAVAAGDEAMARNDRVAGVKAYRKAMQSRTLDNATRQRIEGDVRKEVGARRLAGENHLKRGMMVEASREFKILVDIDPTDENAKAMAKDVEAKLAQKRTLQNDIRTAIAGSQFDKAIKLWDSTPPELRDDQMAKQIEQLRTVTVPALKLAEQGDSFAKQGRLEEAIATFQDALKISPACEPARIGLKEAETKFQRIEFMLKEGYQFSLEQNYAKAVETWKPILQIRPGHPQTIKSMIDAYVAHAQYLRSQGDLEGAINAYKGALETDPQNRSVRKTLEDLTNVYDKESALIDRANDAAARSNLSVAIKYWKEVHKVNPANKKALHQVNQLAKMRSGSRVKWFVILVVLGCGLAVGYQYYTEMMLLREIKKCVGEKNYCNVSSAVSGARIIFLKKDIEEIREQAEIESRIETVKKALLNGESPSSSTLPALIDMLRRRGEDAKVKELLHLQLMATIQQQNQKADAQLVEALAVNDVEAETKFGGAREALMDLQSIIQDFKDPDQVIMDAASQTEREIGVLGLLQSALGSKRQGNKDAALNQFRRAQAQVSGFKVPGMAEYITKKLASLGADTKSANQSITNAYEALKEIDAAGKHMKLKEAKAFFEQAKSNGADNAGEIMQLIQYIDDLNTCEDREMRLYRQADPLATRKWTNDERRPAFCIDPFEYPNKPNQPPMVNITYADAITKCKDDGKVLCSSSDWETACKGGSNFNQPYPYGVNPDPSKCNTDGTAIAPSGSKTGCHNAIGVYDMSGNVAEWVDDPKQNLRDNLATAKGGAFSAPANNASCTDEDPTKLKSEKYKDIGFRCCKRLP